MPLVGGNELSFFSISFTICFYLVINESSVWWQQAAGCLLAAALSSHTRLSNLTMFPLHTHANATNHAHTTYAHNHMFISYRRMYMFFSLFHPESRMQQQTLKNAFHTPFIFILSGTSPPLS